MSLSEVPLKENQVNEKNENESTDSEEFLDDEINSSSLDHDFLEPPPPLRKNYIEDKKNETSSTSSDDSKLENDNDSSKIEDSDFLPIDGLDLEEENFSSSQFDELNYENLKDPKTIKNLKKEVGELRKNVVFSLNENDDEEEEEEEEEGLLKINSLIDFTDLSNRKKERGRYFVMINDYVNKLKDCIFRENNRKRESKWKLSKIASDLKKLETEEKRIEKRYIKTMNRNSNNNNNQNQKIKWCKSIIIHLLFVIIMIWGTFKAKKYLINNIIKPYETKTFQNINFSQQQDFVVFEFEYDKKIRLYHTIKINFTIVSEEEEEMGGKLYNLEYIITDPFDREKILLSKNVFWKMIENHHQLPQFFVKDSRSVVVEEVKSGDILSIRYTPFFFIDQQQEQEEEGVMIQSNFLKENYCVLEIF